jgi:Tfp pilus assembly protein FimT
VKAAQLRANADSHERFGNDGCEAGSDGWTLEQSAKAAAGGRGRVVRMVSQTRKEMGADDLEKALASATPVGIP